MRNCTYSCDRCESVITLDIRSARPYLSWHEVGQVNPIGGFVPDLCDDCLKDFHNWFGAPKKSHVVFGPGAYVRNG